MIEGLLAGFFWGLDTVILGIALVSLPFVSTTQAILLAPFVSTFIHDLASSLWMLVYMGIKGEYNKVIQALTTKSGKVIILAALIGGPIGMTGYVLSIKYIGVSYTAIISALYPAIGAFLSYIFLNDKMKKYQIAGLFVSIGAVIALGYLPVARNVPNFPLGVFFAFLSAFAWASEAVIIAHGLKEPSISNRVALQIRQLVSAIFYGIIILPLLGGWNITLDILFTDTALLIIISALFGTTAYLFYYQSIRKIGPTKAMALNITYSAWAIGFGYILLGESVSYTSVLLALLIVVGSVVAASDTKELFKGKNNYEEK